MTKIGLAALATVLVVAPAPTHADERSTVAVLPWTASTSDFEVYGELVAKAVVQRMQTQSSLRFLTVTGRDKVPAEVEFVVDGRVVAVGADALRLQARVRDPELGRIIADLGTRTAPIGEIDGLAQDIAVEIARALDAAELERRAALAPAPEALTPNAEAAARPGSAPLMLVAAASTSPAQSSVDLVQPTTQAAIELAQRLGYRTLLLPTSAPLSTRELQHLITEHRAAAAVVLEVDHVDYTWRGVLTAKGRFRVALHGSSPAPLFDRWVRTDTVVGSRGDRYAALVYFAAAQAGYIAEPLLRRALR